MAARKPAEEPVEAPDSSQAPAPLGYKVIADRAVFGVEPGGFVEPPTPDSARALIAGGFIALVERGDESQKEGE